MSRNKNLGLLLLGIYLVLISVLQFTGIRLGVLGFIVPLLAFAAGLCLILGK
jgi:hypothetical protein